MSSPFAALEARVNVAVMSRLPNATATIAGGAVDGVFEAAYQDVMGVVGTTPTFVASASVLSGVAQNAALTIDCPPLGLAGATYTVSEAHAEHGMTRLFLRKAA